MVKFCRNVAQLVETEQPQEEKVYDEKFYITLLQCEWQGCEVKFTVKFQQNYFSQVKIKSPKQSNALEA